ncbi:MAG: molybdopterin-dependent oxidoreductase [Candidatus Binataceae bacterium]|nr:molybdopterin-dependent oxidoreductase [Candidatus Binataceae bacterium]
MGQHDFLEAQLTHADDRVRLSKWLPPQWGEMPRVRIGGCWYNILWLIPLGFLFVVIGIPLAQELRQLQSVQSFIQRYPGQTSVPVQYVGFPLWLRVQHFLNLFFILFIIRAGIQILADHPRLYWNRDCTPGTEWFSFQHEVPADRIWTAKDDSVTLPSWFGIPGLRHSIGLARWWHFSFDLLWLLNGIAFYILLFTTHQWERIVPQTWAVFPDALSTAIQYLSLRFPVEESWIRYNGLQLLSYFITVFIAAPVAIITGLMQAPTISNRLGWFGRTLHRQAARSIHFIVLCWFLFFIFIHVTMVFVTGLLPNLNHMFAGINGSGPQGLEMFAAVLVILTVAWVVASPLTINHARTVQKAGAFFIGWLKGLAEWTDPNTQYTEKDISPHFWPDGTMPSSAEFEALAGGNFTDYRLRVDGLVEKPTVFTFAELKAMPKQEQITCHFCIQGWSGVAKWGGVPVRRILEIVKPRPEARYAVFYSFAEGGEGGRYYDVHKLENMRHHLTILAYEMNGAPVSVLHGAPLRLRCENELGFKQVKWIEAIEFVADFAHLGAGQGGYNEDHEFYGYRMPI